MPSVALQGTAAGKACAPQGAPPGSQFIQAEIAGGSITWEGELLPRKTSLTQERERSSVRERNIQQRVH
jgi:hypothetical protein